MSLGEFIDKIGVSGAAAMGVFASVMFSIIIFISIVKYHRIRFLKEQCKFDEEYVKKRKILDLYRPTDYYYPFRDVKTKKFKDLFKDDPINLDWYSKVRDYDVLLFPRVLTPVMIGFIYEIFDDLRSPLSPVYKRVFESTTARIDFWKDDPGYNHDIRTMVKNILSVVPSADLLTKNETYMFAYLIIEVLIDGSMKNCPRRAEILLNKKAFKDAFIVIQDDTTSVTEIFEETKSTIEAISTVCS